MSQASALSARQAAVVAAMEADAGLAAALGGATRIYDGVAPAGAPGRYVVVVSATEAGRGMLGRGGHDGTLTLRLTAESRMACYALYDHVARLFHRTPLALADHTTVAGEVGYSTDFRDPVTKQWQAVATVRHRTLAGAA